MLLIFVMTCLWTKGYTRLVLVWCCMMILSFLTLYSKSKNLTWTFGSQASPSIPDNFASKSHHLPRFTEIFVTHTVRQVSGPLACRTQWSDVIRTDKIPVLSRHPEGLWLKLCDIRDVTVMWLSRSVEMLKVKPVLVTSIRAFSSDSGLPRLRLRGLPFHATAADVRGFFQGFRLAETKAVELLRGHGRRPTGQAFAYFQDVVEAMKAKDRVRNDRKWIQMGTVSCLTICGTLGLEIFRMMCTERFL